MTKPGNLIDGQELEKRLDSDDIRVIDCRFDLGDPRAGREAYLEGHIRGAVFADLDTDLAAPIDPDSGRHPLPRADVFAATLGRLGIDHNTHVVVYDAESGALAARAWWLLRWVSHERVRLLDGGWRQWLAEGRPISKGQAEPQPREFRAVPRNDMIVTTDELAADVGSIGAMNLIDARDSARFRGESEPIDAVAGHIPGSRNLPYSESLHADGRWRRRETLEQIWRRQLGRDRETGWIAMCGSGVTACHLAVSALEAGYREPRIYVGSWSEWIRDPGRPVGLGPAPERASEAADLT